MVVLTAATSLVLSGCLSSSTGAGDRPAGLGEMEPVELKFSLLSQRAGAESKAVRAFAKEVEKNTDGKIKFDIYYNSSLIPPDGTLGSLSRGVADIAYLPMSYFPQNLPVTNWMMPLGSLAEPSPAFGLAQGAGMTMGMARQTDAVQREMKDNGLRLLLQYTVISRSDMLCNKPVRSPADVRGLQVRTPSQTAADEVEALGGTPSQISVTEIYEALQRGVVDCVHGSPGTYIEQGLWDVARHYVPTIFTGYNAGAFAFNQDAWQRLPDDAQRILQESSMRLLQVLLKDKLRTYARFASEGPAKHDIVFHNPSRIDEVLRKHQEKVVSKLSESSPLPADQAKAVIKDYEEKADNWRGIVRDATDLKPTGERSVREIRESYISAGNADLSGYIERVRKEFFSS